MSLVRRNSNLSFCNKFHKRLDIHVFLCRNGTDLLRHNAFSCSIHLCRVIAQNNPPYFLPAIFAGFK